MLNPKMSMNMKRWMMALCLSSLLLDGYGLLNWSDFEYQGIEYRYFSREDRTVSVTYVSRDTTGVVLPSHVVCNDTVYTVVEIYPGAFQSCWELETVELPNTLVTIRRGAFQGCLSLKEVIIPSSVRLIEQRAFYGCNALKKFIHSETLEIIEPLAFCYNGLDSVFMHKNTNYGSGVFSCCDSLKYVEIEDGVTTIASYLFNGYEYRTENLGNQLEEIRLPNTVRHIGEHAFSGTRVTQLNLPSSVTYIGEEAFSHNTVLKEACLPASLDTLGSNVFLQCHSLEKVTFMGGAIDKVLFAGCNKLRTLVFGRQVRYVTSKLFKTYSHDEKIYLADVYCEGTVPPEEGIYIEGATLHVPKGYKEIYATTDNWAKYGDNIVDDIELEGIRSIKNKELKMNNEMFDLQGRRITEPQKGSIYIKKGKKIKK
jgi:hypothetical protein